MAGAYGKIRLFPTSIEYFVVAGGGGGGQGMTGNHQGGGGGAGGALYGVLPAVRGNTFTITIGAGGASTASGNSSTITGSGSVSTTGGGQGGGTTGGPGNGSTGGSGGGGAGSGAGTARPGGSGTAGQGTTGGTGYGTSYGGGGGGAGGGSGFPLVDATTSVSGRGGPGLQFPIFTNGYSVYFDGTGDFLTVPHNTALELGTGDYTIEGWWYFTDTSNQAMVSKYAATLGYVVQYQSGNLRMVLGLSGSDAVYPFAWTPVANTWYHVAITRSGSSGRAFINGTQIGTTTTFTNANVGTTADLQIGSTQTVSEFTRGYVSNVRIVKGTALYTSNFTPSTLPLTAITNTSLLTCQNSTIRDNSSNNFSITVSNAVARQSGPFNFYGINSYSNYFDGNGDSLTTPGSTSYNFESGDFTIEAWVYLTTLTGGGGGVTNGSEICTTFPNSGTINGFGFRVMNTGFIVFETYVSGTAQAITANTNSLIANSWYHVAVTKSSGTFRLFVNGVVTTFTGTMSQNINSTNNILKIGTCSYSTYVNNFTGYISNLRIIKGTSMYTANFTPTTTPLTAITNTVLLTCQDPTIRDNSSNNFTITTNGNATPAIHNPFLENTYYAAGGGGAGTPGIGGFGGGGLGGASSAPTAGRTNSGSGGGGGTATGSTPGGAGGSGTVIIRFPAADKIPTSILGSYTMVVSEGFRIYQWTSSGSMTF